MAERLTIGVFDSGFGGLTVLRALERTLPGASFVYLGDTARLPYGSKSADTVTRYTGEAVRVLRDRGARMVVLACNTASALALPRLRTQSAVPLAGVILPGARSAAQAVIRRGERTVLVLATEATVSSGAYARACAAHGVAVHEKACPLLVPLVEEGWTDHVVTADVARIYLGEALSEMRSGAIQSEPAAVLLGCTHYPLLRPLLERTVHELLGPLPVVDSAEATAAHVRTLQPQASVKQTEPAPTQFLATDSPAKFQRLGERFLGRAIEAVEMVDLDR